MPSEAVALPEGTVTVLATDLVGSTLLNQRLGDEAATALEREIAELARAHTTPVDMTVFGQMILNGGRYGGVRILSPAAVAAMPRDQIPGIGARFFNQVKM